MWENRFEVRDRPPGSRKLEHPTQSHYRMARVCAAGEASLPPSSAPFTHYVVDNVQLQRFEFIDVISAPYNGPGVAGSW